MNKLFTNLFNSARRGARERINIALFICPVIFFVTACQPTDTNISKNPFCQHPQNTNEYCSFALGDYQFWLSSSDPEMPIERGVTLSLTSNKPITDVVAEIRGVSMYMGRLPVIWEQVDAQHWRADVSLGACTDPDMVWRMILTINQREGERSASHEVLFQSYIP